MAVANLDVSYTRGYLGRARMHVSDPLVETHVPNFTSSLIESLSADPQFGHSTDENHAIIANGIRARHVNTVVVVPLIYFVFGDEEPIIDLTDLSSGQQLYLGVAFFGQMCELCYRSYLGQQVTRDKQSFTLAVVFTLSLSTYARLVLMLIGAHTQSPMFLEAGGIIPAHLGGTALTLAAGALVTLALRFKPHLCLLGLLGSWLTWLLMGVRGSTGLGDQTRGGSTYDSSLAQSFDWHTALSGGMSPTNIILLINLGLLLASACLCVFSLPTKLAYEQRSLLSRVLLWHLILFVVTFCLINLTTQFTAVLG